ncbi:extensin-like isoform X1 [Asparagus officinalis]|uniref:extensin-like isoform X1 n=1 Tax=Asparagus officinalis TaxID=4686 RepID=UPI00098E66B2|nr:extensin-like isoform X1 [Asparagus officinalis]
MRKAKKEKAKEEGPGFIFMCSWRTRQECFRHGVFGMPMSRAEIVKMIKPEMRLFLYNVGQKLLYGIFRASSEGGMNLVPEAFGGCFPAQVRFKTDLECLPLAESTFKQAILENYSNDRFQPYLNPIQVQKLVALFQSSSAAPQPATLHVENQPIAAPAPLPPTTEPPGSAHIPSAYLLQPEERQASPPAPFPPITEPYRSAHTPPAYLPQLESIHVPSSAPSSLTTEPYRSAHLPPVYLPQLEIRHIPSATPLSPTTKPYRSAHIPPAYFPQLESRHVPSSAPLPSTTEPYRSAHIPPASLPPPEDQCRPSTHQAPFHLPPSDDDDQYLSRRHLASHLPPYADPYIGRAPAASDSNYISTHIPTTENDLHYSTTCARAADPYYPPPSSSIYRLSEAAHAFFPENPNTDPPPPSSIYRPSEAVRACVPEKPITSDRLGYRVFLETVEDPNAHLSRDYQSLHRTDGYVTPQGNQIDSRYPLEQMGSNSRYERLPLSSYRYDPSLYMQGRSSTDAQQRQPSSSVSVSSRYTFAGAAPAHR